MLISCFHTNLCFYFVQIDRKNLTELKVYAIDVDEADEVNNQNLLLFDLVDIIQVLLHLSSEAYKFLN